MFVNLMAMAKNLIQIVKKYQTCKPGSVEPYHLSSHARRDQATYPLQ